MVEHTSCQVRTFDERPERRAYCLGIVSDGPQQQWAQTGLYGPANLKLIKIVQRQVGPALRNCLKQINKLRLEKPPVCLLMHGGSITQSR